MESRDYEVLVARVSAGVVSRESALNTLRHAYAVAGLLAGPENAEQGTIRAIAGRIKALPAPTADPADYWRRVAATAERVMGA